jgi:hypothetical protein
VDLGRKSRHAAPGAAPPSQAERPLVRTISPFGPELSPQQQADVAAAYQSGMSNHAIAATFRIHVKHIKTALRAHGIARRGVDDQKQEEALHGRLEIPAPLLLLLPKIRMIPRVRQNQILKAYQASSPAERLIEIFNSALTWPQ